MMGSVLADGVILLVILRYVYSTSFIFNTLKPLNNYDSSRFKIQFNKSNDNLTQDVDNFVNLNLPDNELIQVLLKQEELVLQENARKSEIDIRKKRR